ncbi:hypothetical protein ACQ4PT_015783 [Festuca glaucescens]
MANASRSSVVAAAIGGDLTATAIVAQAVRSHIIRIEGYSHTKDLGTGNFVASETFAVGRHRWRMEYYPDGRVPDTQGWIDICVRLVDADAAGEVQGKVRFSLLDQGGNPVAGHTFTIPLFGGAAGDVTGLDLIERSDLEESAYLRDDVFSVRCDVTVAVPEVTTKSIHVSQLRRDFMEQKDATAPVGLIVKLRDQKPAKQNKTKLKRSTGRELMSGSLCAE